jgi:hypothetical protein
MLTNPVIDHFRCPPLPPFEVRGSLSDSKGFFRFGNEAICYGRVAGNTSPGVNGHLFDASEHVCHEDGTVGLPFDAGETIDNLRYERYVNGSVGRRWVEQSWVKGIYYGLRPIMPVSLRKHLQQIYLRDWNRIAFPNWPVDRSADILLERLLVIAMKEIQIDRLPFIWFWPDGHKACAIMTHDVETAAGRDFCDHLMDIDDEFGIKASFQIVPEKRYEVPESFLESIRQRGFEINVQGLDHDGDLFADRQGFLKRAKRINEYSKKWDAQGFRSPILYRNNSWFRDLDFKYDMSVPNVARMEPQRGGCCTVLPYTLPGGTTELPVTVAEDYTLFNIIQDYSIALWKRQMRIIADGHGLMNFIIHPDYILNGRARPVYTALLHELLRLRTEESTWIPLPREVDRWWRARNEMTLVHNRDDWAIKGPESQRARFAYARLDGGRLAYELTT